MGDYASMSVKEIDALLSRSESDDLSRIIPELSLDERIGVKKLVLKYNAKQQKITTEKKRIENLKRIEEQLYEDGYQLIAGTDEVGRGPLCGPVVSAAVILSRESRILYINDSKQLSQKKREELCELILSEAVGVGIGIVDNRRIDQINILNATKESMVLALNNLSQKPDILLLDAMTIAADIKQRSFIKGDATVYSIAAASIVAKVTRDRMMEEYDPIYPQYGLKSNKGYGSSEHIQAIREYGPTPIHRMSFIHSFLPRQANRKIGQKWEDRASEYLMGIGYELVQKNYVRAGGELDLIMKDGEEYVFCEVKARSDASFGAPEEFVDVKKQQRMIMTAQNYMAEKAIFQIGRFDVVAIEFDANDTYKIRHLKNAFGA